MTEQEAAEANRRYQAVWRKKHFQLYGEYQKIMDSFARMPDLLDRLGNPTLAKKIRKAVRLMDDENE